MKILQLGNACAFPNTGQYHVSYIIDLEKSYLLLEAPPTILSQITKAYIDVDQIEWIYISHQHGDHILGIPMLLVTSYAKKSEKVWKIISFKIIERIIKRIVRDVYPELTDYMDKYVKFLNIEEDNFSRIKLTDKFIISTALASHGVPSAGIRIEDNSSSIVYSGDTGKSENILKLAKDADLLIHESNSGLENTPSTKHSTVDDAAETAEKSNCKNLWLTHLKYINDQDIINYLKRAETIFKGRTEIIADFRWIEI